MTQSRGLLLAALFWNVQSAIASPGETSREVQIAYSLIREMPLYGGWGQDTSLCSAKTLETARRLHRLPVRSVRMAIKVYLLDDMFTVRDEDDPNRRRAQSRLNLTVFMLNRVLFNVPYSEPTGGSEAVLNQMSITQPSGLRCWPLICTGGKLNIADLSDIATIGQSLRYLTYDPLDEYDMLSRTFGRRSILNDDFCFSKMSSEGTATPIRNLLARPPSELERANAIIGLLETTRSVSDLRFVIKGLRLAPAPDVIDALDIWTLGRDHQGRKKEIGETKRRRIASLLHDMLRKPDAVDEQVNYLQSRS